MHNKQFFSLTKKTLLAICLILLPVIITFAYSYQKNIERLKKDVVNDMTVVAEAYEGQVYQFIEMSKRRAMDFSSDGFIIRALEAEDISGLSKHLVEKKIPLDPHINTITIITPDGTVIASTDDAYAGADFSEEMFFLDGRGKTSATETTDEAGRAQLVLSTPITGPARQTIGVLANHMLLSELSDVLNGDFNKKLGAISWKKGRRTTMDSYIVNRDGLIVAGSKLAAGKPPVAKVASMPVAA